MMDGNDASQELGAAFLSSDSQLFVQSDGDGKSRNQFLNVIQCDDILFKLLIKRGKQHGRRQCR